MLLHRFIREKVVGSVKDSDAEYTLPVQGSALRGHEAQTYACARHVGIGYGCFRYMLNGWLARWLPHGRAGREEGRAHGLAGLPQGRPIGRAGKLAGGLSQVAAPA